VPHRRGSFHEDWNELLVRFAHRGTPAALKDQVKEAQATARQPSGEFDPHRALFERSARNGDTFEGERAWTRPSTSREASKSSSNC
jgi:hypothetical protein